MSSIPILDAAIVAYLDAELPGTRLGSDYGDADVPLSHGVSVYQLRVNTVGEESAGSNVQRIRVSIDVVVIRKLSPSNERGYTLADMQDEHALLRDRSGWLGITGIYSVVEGPEITDGPERVGNALEYTFSLEALTSFS